MNNISNYIINKKKRRWKEEKEAEEAEECINPTITIALHG